MTKNKQNIFTDMPIWKALLKTSIPSLIITLVFGAYFFSDQILSIQFASDSYPVPSKSPFQSEDLVRVYMNGFSPINALMIAFTLLFGVGTATRVSINLGAKRKERAHNTMKAGFSSGMLISIIMIPILMFTAKPWIGSQYSEFGDQTTIIENESFKYAWIIIMSFPLMMFNQMIPSLMRTEGRNREPVIALVVPIFINLLFDWILMGPAGMGVNGGAWATFIATSITTVILLILLLRKRKAFVNLKDLFALKSMKLISLGGIILVGLSPFIRNMARSITSTVQMNVMTDVAKSVYSKDPRAMKFIVQGAMPIFMLFFPMVFGFVQGASPLASYFYGAKEYHKVKKVYWFSLLYMLLITTTTYFIGAWALANPLMEAQKVNPNYIDDTKSALKIIMLIMVVFSFAISGIVILGSTDRLFLSLLASSLQGFIVFFPTIYVFKEIAISHAVDYKYAFWWFWPTSGAIAAIIIVFMTWWALSQMKKKEIITLDERIQKVHQWAKARRVARKAKK